MNRMLQMQHLNPLLVCTDYLFLLAHCISNIKHVENKNFTPISNICKQLTSIFPNLNNFHSLEVVDRVSETQLQVSENSN